MNSTSVVARVVVPITLWAWLFWHLRDEWSLNPQYHYGWAVPFLAVLLFFLRWRDQPPAAEPAPPILSLRILEWVLLLMLLPFRIVEEANPDWRALGWLLGLIATVYSVIALRKIGGAIWARHFLFPICFVLAAVPWPVQLENVVVQNLSRAVATVAVEVAGWVGIGAYQLGNVIQLPNGFVEVDEACSGVKTLQAAIMMTLFLGELFRLSVQRRVLLLVLGALWVFLCNIFRASALVLVAAKQGLGSLAHWHDTIGTTAMVAGMGGLVGLAALLNEREGASSSARQPFHLRRVSISETMIGLGWLAAIFLATEFWYRIHEREFVVRPAWTIDWPADSEAFRPLQIPETTRTILHYDEASSAAWRQSPGTSWWGFFARWAPKRGARQLARSHSPDVCLPAIGRNFKGALPSVTVDLATPNRLATDDYSGAVGLNFRAYEFEQAGRPLFVFVAIRDDKISAKETEEPVEWNTRGRLLAAWRGRRNLGQRLLELAVGGSEDFSQARAAVQELVKKIAVMKD